MQLFYNPYLNLGDTEFSFDKIESRHIVRVLRKKEGDTLHITNGKGLLVTSEIIIANDKKCLVKIISIEQIEKPWNYYLHIVIAPTKSNDRFEWFLEKATEIGIDEITPIICDHSERKVIKIERLQKIIESAGKQSLKFHFPKLNDIMHFDDYITSDCKGQKYIAHCENDKQRVLFNNALKKEEPIIMLIGPEGDFSSKEIIKAKEANFIPVSLGANRLRTETAGIVATHSVSLLNEI